MLDDYTRGGQIFIHRIRMFRQVISASSFWSLMIAIILTFFLTLPQYRACNMHDVKTYIRASCLNTIWQYLPKISDDAKNRVPTIDIYDSVLSSNSRTVNISTILASPRYQKEINHFKQYLLNLVTYATSITIGLAIIIFAVWSKFGKTARESKHISGSTIKNVKEIRKYLKKHNLISKFHIGDMPLIKDIETRHFLVTGSTGSGKTNLINTLLPQIRIAKQPSIVVDQTGEMIEQYYDPNRGDIIFNPLDARSHSWDFWLDATSGGSVIGEIDPRLETFAKVLFSFGRKHLSDPFWQNSAETLFVSCVESLLMHDNKTINALKNILIKTRSKDLAKILVGTRAQRYFTQDKNNNNTAESILSVMTTGVKPLSLLFESNKKFSLKQYFKELEQGKDSWLFLSSSPSQREVTLPLLACILELAVSYLVEQGINEQRRIWFVIDELASLGKLNALSTLLAESRKYGGCVLAATQSLNQIFDKYGHYAGSTLFDQFATKFMFRSTDPSTARLISDMFGSIEYASQQKNTSYGAHEHRDGVSYTEQEKRKSLITTNDIASLKDLECFVDLADPQIRIAKLQLKPANVQKKNKGYIAHDTTSLYQQTTDLHYKRLEDSPINPHFLTDLQHNIEDGKDDEIAEHILETTISRE